MEYGHGQSVQLKMSMMQSKTLRSKVVRYIWQPTTVAELPKRTEISSIMGYDPEMGVIPKLDLGAALFFQLIIDFLRCIVELGRIDIIMEVSFLPSLTMIPSGITSRWIAGSSSTHNYLLESEIQINKSFSQN